MERGAVMIVNQWPKTIETADGIICNPTPDQCRQAGYELYVPPTAEEIAEQERIERERIEALPFAISKIKLGDAFESLGVIAQFDAYIASNPTTARRYRDAVVLMSDDEMVTSAMGYFKQSLHLDDEQIKLMLKSCKSDI
jgi:hypothetical protein